MTLPMIRSLQNMKRLPKISLPDNNDSPPLNKKGKKRVQQVTRSFLYYGHAVDILNNMMQFK